MFYFRAGVCVFLRKISSNVASSATLKRSSSDGTHQAVENAKMVLGSVIIPVTESTLVWTVWRMSSVIMGKSTVEKKKLTWNYLPNCDFDGTLMFFYLFNRSKVAIGSEAAPRSRNRDG